MNIQLVRAIFSGKWFIEPSEAEALIPIALNLLEGKPIGGLPGAMGYHDDDDFEERKKCQVVLKSGSTYQASYFRDFSDPNIPEGATALINLTGPVMKYGGYCGEASSERIANFFKQANANPNIKNILFKVDSPGGQVDGTATMAQAVYNSTKPVLGFVDDGMAASAGYWPLAGADEIWASQKTDIIGSIGVYAQWADYSKRYEELGIKIHEVYADQSSEKNKLYHEVIKGNYKPIKEEVLNKLAGEFISSVKEMRGAKINLKAGDPFKGTTYMAEQAIEIGLIDKIGSYEEALARLEEMSQAKPAPETASNQSQTTNTQTMKFKSAWAAILGSIGFGAVASEEEAPMVTEERLEQLNASLTTANQSISDLKAEIAQLKSDLKTAQDAQAKAEGERDDFQAKADKFGKQAGAAHTPPKKDKAEGGNTELSADEQTAAEIAALPHNAALDSNPLFN
ncbi:S49 family peptidase [Algoriphagus resistens]|uniref:S49 family peptidase n=1 Tax=Algoriphagus resistens TaxID=1750590 RepID=UPI000716C1D1|nr:S49 family peptidase [Algoriphagus resistens]